MKQVGAYEAKTHLAQLLDDVERGASITITRRGTPIATLVPAVNHDRQSTQKTIERMKQARARRPKMTTAEILAARDEGRKPVE